MMDRALKERIIGAVVLVLFVVLVVPVFLDGPADNGEMLSERVPLPGQSEQKVQTIVLDRDRKEPVPAAQSSAPSEASPEPQQDVATPPVPIAQSSPVVEKKLADDAQDKPVPAPVAESPATTSATGMWAVQLGSFGSQENAERLAADLRKQGFAAFLSQLSTSDGQLHRVRIGPQKDRESAEAMAERLAKVGHTGQVVPHP